MAGKTSKASTRPPGEALSPKHEAFVQAYVSRGMNGTKAYRAARAAAAGLLANVSIRARVEEILAAGAERAEITVEQVLRELAVLGFSDIGKVVRWRPELVFEEIKDEENPDAPARQVLQSRVLVIDSATLPPEARLAVAEVSQTANGGLRVKMHDKHGPLVSIGKHLGMFVDQVQVRARYAISDQPMSAEEWKKQYVKEG
jgi:phage terminase small subunit